MKYKTIYDFYALWHKIENKSVPIENIHTECNWCLDKMIDVGLIEKNEEIIIQGGMPVVITLYGLETKELGGWLKYLRNTSPKWYVRHSKAVIVALWSALGIVLLGLVTMIAYDWLPTWIKGGAKKPAEIQEQSPSKPQLPPQLNMDSISHTKDSLLHSLDSIKKPKK